MKNGVEWCRDAVTSDCAIYLLQYREGLKRGGKQGFTSRNLSGADNQVPYSIVQDTTQY